MTRPNGDYINHLMGPTHDEFRQRVNQEWLKAGINVGDVCIGKTSGELGHVMKMPVPNQHGSHRTSWVVIHPVRTGTFRTAYDHTLLLAEEWQWVPSLDQAVRMVQALGYKVKIGQDSYTYFAEAYAHKTEPAQGAKHEGGWEIVACCLLDSLWAT